MVLVYQFAVEHAIVPLDGLISRIPDNTVSLAILCFVEAVRYHSHAQHAALASLPRALFRQPEHAACLLPRLPRAFAWSHCSVQSCSRRHSPSRSVCRSLPGDYGVVTAPRCSKHNMPHRSPRRSPSRSLPCAPHHSPPCRSPLTHHYLPCLHPLCHSLPLPAPPGRAKLLPPPRSPHHAPHHSPRRCSPHVARCPARRTARCAARRSSRRGCRRC